MSFGQYSPWPQPAYIWAVTDFDYGIAEAQESRAGRDNAHPCSLGETRTSHADAQKPWDDPWDPLAIAVWKSRKHTIYTAVRGAGDQ